MISFSMDAHMHFDLYKDRKAVADYIECMRSYTIAVTNLPVLFEKYYPDYQHYRYMKLALGFHPELACEYQNQLSIFIKNIDKTRYIGEIGLDFSTPDLNNRKSQVKTFSDIIQICSEHKNKILSIHSRKAHKEVMDVLKGFQGAVILHWYSGAIRELNIALERGYYFSINQQMVRSSSGKRIIDAIPVDKILIESDAPFTYGLKDRYDLFFVNEIYAYLAKTRDLSLEEISKIIKNNFRKVLL